MLNQLGQPEIVPSLPLAGEGEQLAMHDSGGRREFATGSMRDTAADKPRLALISPVFLLQTYDTTAQETCGHVPTAFPGRDCNRATLLDLCGVALSYWQMRTLGPDWLAIAAHAMAMAMTFAPDADRIVAPACDSHGLHPVALRRLGHVLRRGAVKYAPDNWCAGQPTRTVVCDSAMRHLISEQLGESDEDHAAHFLANLSFLADYEWHIARGLLPADLDDRRPFGQRATESAC